MEGDTICVQSGIDGSSEAGADLEEDTQQNHWENPWVIQTFSRAMNPESRMFFRFPTSSCK